MLDQSKEQQQAALLEKIPASGEVAYDDVFNQLVAAGNKAATRHFHAMRRAGQIATRISEDGTLMISRPTGGA